MLALKIRIHTKRNETTYKKIYDYIKSDDKVSKWMLCLEEAGESNEHVHIYVVTQRKIESYRQRFTKEFVKKKGNGSYSINKLNEENPIEYIAYMMKQGRYESNGIPDEIVDQAKKYDEKVKENKNKKSIEKLEDYLRQEMGDMFDYEPYWRTTRREIFKIIIRYYIKNKVVFNKTKVHSAFTYIACKKYEYFVEELCQLIDNI